MNGLMISFQRQQTLSPHQACYEEARPTISLHSLQFPQSDTSEVFVIAFTLVGYSHLDI